MKSPLLPFILGLTLLVSAAARGAEKPSFIVINIDDLGMLTSDPLARS